MDETLRNEHEGTLANRDIFRDNSGLKLMLAYYNCDRRGTKEKSPSKHIAWEQYLLCVRYNCTNLVCL